ncbi:MAG: transglycosylase SLT domain-containing protein [Bacteroidales bacterium]|nr:transglycosylase SLT domain-containing protein [Bacteroidales bacterium]MBQ5424339.1 transglycosylase SLT domain-containing protein [Bacteroidales bacterium]
MDSKARISRITVLSALSMWIVVGFLKLYIEETKEVPPEPFERDYSGIAASETLNVALSENATEYCIFNATPRGFQLETLEDFCKEHNLELNIIPIWNEIIAERALAAGKCDLIAKHAFVTDSTMSQPLLRSSLVILSRTKQIPDTIYTTGTHRFVTNYNGKTIICSNIFSQEKIARKVASGEINAAICDSALALTYQKAYPQLKIDTSICLPQDIVWQTNPNAKVLLDSINAWLSRVTETKKYKLRHEIYYSYININVSSQYYSGNGNKISAYDDLIRKHSKKLQWDWRYIASLIYEESHFYPNISNPSGAYGLMQLMPAAYQKFAHDSADISDPEVQLMAGIKHVDYLKKHTPESITDTAVIIRYVLMGYNAGHGHSEDAFHLAEKYSDNPNSWHNLAEYMKLLYDKNYYTDPVVKCGKYKGSRTVTFTNNVVNRYKHYRNLIKE